MSMKKELIVYFASREGIAQGVEAGSTTIAAACVGLRVRVARGDDLSMVAASPAVGITVEGLPDEIETLEVRLREAGCRLVDGSRQIHVLGEEGGQQP